MSIRNVQKELDVYLKEQKKYFGCDVKYWGRDKNRLNLILLSQFKIILLFKDEKRGQYYLLFEDNYLSLYINTVDCSLI